MAAALQGSPPAPPAQFETAVEHGIAAVEDPTPELVAFFAQVDARRTGWIRTNSTTPPG